MGPQTSEVTPSVTSTRVLWIAVLNAVPETAMRVAASAAAVAVGLCAVRTTAAGDRRAAGDTVVPGDPNSVLLVRSKARPPTAYPR